MKKPNTIILILAVCLALSCILNLYLGGKQEQKSAAAQQSPKNTATETYVYIPPFINDPMVEEQDMAGLEKFAEEKNVRVEVKAPERYDAVEVKKIMEEVIRQKPDGIMLCATEEFLVPTINYAMDAGIPVVTIDADRPESKRLTYVGSNWNAIGTKQAEAMVKLINGKGIVAAMGIVGNVNTRDAYEGFQNLAEEYEDITILGLYDDVSNRKEAKRITLDLLAKHPDLSALAAFDSNSAFGICEALEEQGKIGEVKVVSVDMTTEHIELLKSGKVQCLVGQKRELFPYYAGKILYDYNHSQLEVVNQDSIPKITNIPEYIDTGIVVLDSEDVK